MSEPQSFLCNLSKAVATESNVRPNKSNNNFFETMKEKLKKISSKQGDAATPTRHIRNSFLYSNISDKHKNKIESCRKSVGKGRNKDADVFVINTLSNSNKDPMTVTKFKSNTSRQSNANTHANAHVNANKTIKNFFFTNLNNQIKKIAPVNNANNNKKKVSNVESDAKHTRVNTILIQDFNLLNRDQDNNPKPPNIFNNLAKIEKFNGIENVKNRSSTANNTMNKREHAEFLEKISTPIDDRYFNMDKTGFQFHKNKQLYKTTNRYTLKSSSSQPAFIVKNKKHEMNLKSNKNSSSTSIQKLLAHSRSHSDVLNNPKNNHLLRMMQIGFKYYKLKSNPLCLDSIENKNRIDEKIKSTFIDNVKKFITKEKKVDANSKHMMMSLSDNFSISKILDDFNRKEEFIEDNISNTKGMSDFASEESFMNIKGLGSIGNSIVNKENNDKNIIDKNIIYKNL